METNRENTIEFGCIRTVLTVLINTLAARLKKDKNKKNEKNHPEGIAHCSTCHFPIARNQPTVA